MLADADSFHVVFQIYFVGAAYLVNASMSHNRLQRTVSFDVTTHRGKQHTRVWCAYRLLSYVLSEHTGQITFTSILTGSYTTVSPSVYRDQLDSDAGQGSHPNDEDAHFRMSEEQIFTSIFTYVDHLFGKIKPKKLFFMAVDGVAPRAKMNQQRSRRFRSAREARELREKAERKGEKLPESKPFDSNCITPGAFPSIHFAEVHVALM